MNKAQNHNVQKFLEEIQMLNEQQYKILQALREIVFAIHPAVQERMMYGGIMFSLKDDFGGIFVSKNHVSFEFGHGFAMKDPEKLLEGTGKFRRHLKVKSLEDIKNKQVDFFVRQVV